MVATAYKVESTLRPVEFLNRVVKANPAIWPRIEFLRGHRDQYKMKWPKWCFLPFGCWAAAGVGDPALDLMDFSSGLVGDIVTLSIVGTWRYSQGIYRIDTDVEEALWSAPLTGNLPTIVLERLPEWCVYIELSLPRLIFGDHLLRGFWSSMDTNGDGLPLLHFLINTEGYDPTAFSIMLAKAPIDELVHQAFCRMRSANEIKGMSASLAKMVSLLLYLCVDKPEYDGHEPRSGRPQPKRTKKGFRIFPAAGPKAYTLGEKTGELIRRYRDTAPGPPTGRRVTPHFRRFHYQGYWTGPRTGTREYKLNWKAPIFVNAEDGEERQCPAT